MPSSGSSNTVSGSQSSYSSDGSPSVSAYGPDTGGANYTIVTPLSQPDAGFYTQDGGAYYYGPTGLGAPPIGTGSVGFGIGLGGGGATTSPGSSSASPLPSLTLLAPQTPPAAFSTPSAN